MTAALFIKNRQKFEKGIKFTSKKILQWAVILLGFGMNLTVILEIGRQSLPIIISTITASLIIAYALHRAMKIPSKISTLVGVGSSICGGSAIAATAPVIDANDEEVAQAISVIFFFNVLAALIFPAAGGLLGFSQTDGNAFGIFAGTAINDTSSVTAAASTWDSVYGLGSSTLDTAVTVKLTRTLAIIPITLILAFLRAALAAAAVANYLITPGLLCAVLMGVAALVITNGLQILLITYQQGVAFSAASSLAGREILVTLPLTVLVYLPFRWVRRRIYSE